MKDTKKTVIRYLITFGAALAVSMLIIWLRDLNYAESAAERYKILSDAFTVPGVVLVCFSGLLKLSSDGFFDSIAYSFSRVGGMLIPFFKTKHETYYDYKMRKAEKRGQINFRFLFLVGMVFIIISLIFILLYEKYKLPN